MKNKDRTAIAVDPSSVQPAFTTINLTTGKTTKEDYETIMSNLLPIEIKALQNTKENIEKGGVKFLMTLRKQGIYSNDVIDTLMRSANNADKLRKLLLKKFKPSE